AAAAPVHGAPGRDHHRHQGHPDHPNRRPPKPHAHPPESVSGGWDGTGGRTVPDRPPGRGLWTVACRVGPASGSLLGSASIAEGGCAVLPRAPHPPPPP